MSELKQTLTELTDEIELSMSDQIDRIKYGSDMETIRGFLGEVVLKAYLAGHQAALEEQSEGDGRWVQ